MRPHLLTSLNLEKLEELKREIKSILIANSRERVTLDQFPHLFESQLGDPIPFKDYNFCSLKEFLLSIPDTVRLCMDKTTSVTYVYPVESEKTKHISSLIARQKTNGKCKKLQHKSRFHSNYIDPILLTTLILKLSSKGCVNKVDLLAEIETIIGVQCSYTIGDLNAQLGMLSHMLFHNKNSIYLKDEATSYSQENLLCNFIIKPKTIKRLQKLLTEKYPEGIWCQQLPYLYLKEYGIELEYRNLGFNDIVEFIAVLPASIFKCTRPPNSFKYKLFSSETEMLVNNQLKNSTVADSIEKVADDIKVDTSHALFTLHSCSKALSKRLIPKEFMNFEDSVKQINVATVLDNSGVIVSEIYNPSLFWIILHRNKRKLIKLMDNLQEFYLGQADLDKYKVPPIVLKPGLHVACLYSNRWHRGIVKSAANLNSSIILFYDYGTTKAYKANKLYFLHKKFSYLPAQAIPSCLYDVKPTASCNKWTQEAIEKFVDKTIEKDFLVSIHNRNQENNSITVDLIDVCTSNTINHWLVSNDLAMFVRKEINFISSEEQQYSTSYVRPAKQLEALKKYKTRLQLLEKQNLQSTSSNLSGSVEEKNKDSAKTILSNNNYYVDHCENTGIDNIQNCETQKLVIKKQHITEALKELEKLIMFTKI